MNLKEKKKGNTKKYMKYKEHVCVLWKIFSYHSSAPSLLLYNLDSFEEKKAPGPSPQAANFMTVMSWGHWMALCTVQR